MIRSWSKSFLLLHHMRGDAMKGQPLSGMVSLEVIMCSCAPLASNNKKIPKQILWDNVYCIKMFSCW